MQESRIQFGLVATFESTRVVLPLKAVMCDFFVEGGLAQVTITQVFVQDNKLPMDFLYQFPLPADASVYSCKIFINDRVIIATVEEREAARKLIKQKKAEGHRTALVESERENLFTLSLGNLQPEDLVEVRLAYMQPLRRLTDSFSLDVPFCPGMRYIPGRPMLRSNRGKGIFDDTDQVPDASRISPLRMDQFHPDAAFVEITGVIEGGFVDAASIICPSHKVTTHSEDRFLRIELDDKGNVPDRDFVLRWKEKTTVATAPRAWIYRKDHELYALMEIRASENAIEAHVLPQDVYFLVDRSGSMAGKKWQKAIEALQSCVGVLAPQDRVMVTVFETTFKDFAERPLAPSVLLQDNNFRQLFKIGTGGGTEMGPALSHVLELVQKHSKGRRSNLVLVTDAQIGNERDILEIMNRMPRLAVHCFGIDNTLNDALLLALTRQQGGTFHSLNPNDNISAAVSALGRTLRQPVLLDMKLNNDWEAADRCLPDLYAGQVQYACAKNVHASPLSITALDTAGQAIGMQFETIDSKNPGPYIHWCKTRIQRLMAEDAQSSAAIELSKVANLICELTAFVAWDIAQKVAVATHDLTQPSIEISMRCCSFRSPDLRAGIVSSSLVINSMRVGDKPEDLKPRPPVVTIMGHVDHGKTTLLDVIRKANAANNEPGETPQHIGAYTISLPHPNRPKEILGITFLDMQGCDVCDANIADIAVLVVAADDGVVPQTEEAINHAIASKVQIIVAVNKCDHPNANPMQVRQQLQEYGLVCEEWGGNTIFQDISALTKKGVDKLLELILLQAEVMELKANPNRPAKGNVIESGLEYEGPTATVLVREGTLKVGDIILCGPFWGKVCALISEEGKPLKSAGPSVAVKLLGLNGIPEAGLEFEVVENEILARELGEKRIQKARERGVEDCRKVTLEFRAVENKKETREENEKREID